MDRGCAKVRFSGQAEKRRLPDEQVDDEEEEVSGRPHGTRQRSRPPAATVGGGRAESASVCRHRDMARPAGEPDLVAVRGVGEPA